MLFSSHPVVSWLFATPWTAARQASLTLTISRSLPKFMYIALVMPSSHLVLRCPLLLLPSSFPNIRDFSSGSAVHIKWPKYWSFSFSISPSNEYSGLISFKTNWFDLLSVQVSYFGIKYYKIYNMSDFLHILKSCLNFFFKEQSRI